MSSMILALGWNEESDRLVAQFDTDTFYLYENVGPLMAARIIYAYSAGQAFTLHIKKARPGTFPYRKITREEVEAL